MKVLVCGGRDYRWRSVVYNALDRFDAKHGIELIITGAAMGADQLAETWAGLRYKPYVGVPADWKANGKAAGPMRNQIMLEKWEPDCVIAFPGGSGTEDMIKRAEAAGLNVWMVKDGEDS